MRYDRQHKEETRQKVLDAAGRGFRRQGFSGTGVDGIAKSAGVTSGAFYAHFGSKDAAFAAALTAGLDEVIESLPKYQRAHGPGWVKAFVAYYLGKPHRSDLACGCAMATLTPDVVRSGPKARAAYEKKMIAIATLVAGGLAGTSQEDRQARAWAMLSVLIGGLNVVLAMKSTKTADEVAAAVGAAAIKLAGRTRAIE